MALGSTQPVTNEYQESSRGIKSGWRVWLTVLPPSMSRMSENVGASTSHNPKGLHGLYRDKLTLPYHTICTYVFYRLLNQKILAA
jgi:hypothetical protein